jgi:tetratricopeptide (TPR) repeat protein
LSGGGRYPGGSLAAEELPGHVAARLREWLAARGDGSGDGSAGVGRLERVVRDWTDAARHYDSALAVDPGMEEARHNRAVAGRLLGELRKALEATRQAIEQQPPPQTGPGTPDQQPPESKPGEQAEGEVPKREPGEAPTPEQGERRDPGGEDEPRESPAEGSERERDGQSQGEARTGEPPRPGESPAERARRLLRENADLEQGPLLQRPRRDFLPPEKDW